MKKIIIAVLMFASFIVKSQSVGLLDSAGHQHLINIGALVDSTQLTPIVLTGVTNGQIPQWLTNKFINVTPLWLLKSDTAAMLAGYQTAIGLRLLKSDTAAMLAGYGTAIGLRLLKSDTAAMLAGYGTAINTNTANILTKWGVTGNSVTAGSQFLGSTNLVSLRVRTNNVERLVVDSVGNVGIGLGTGGVPGFLLDIQKVGNGATAPFLSIFGYSGASTSNAAYIELGKSRSSVIATLTTTIDADNLGAVDYNGVTATNTKFNALRISGLQDGTAGLTKIGARLGIFISDTSTALTEKYTFKFGGMGIFNTSPNAAAALDITSTTKGLLIPRMTTTQQNAIASPVSGLLIWNTDTLGLVSYNGTVWRKALTTLNGVTSGTITWPGTIYTTPTTGVVTGSNLDFAPALATQTANTVFSGATSGGAATPAFRSLVLADLPTITEAKGGTNQTTYTTGDVLYASGSNTLAKLAVGSANQVLQVIGGVPTWQTPGTGGTVTTFSVVTANGVSASVANASTTPAATFTLGAITPTTVNGNTFTTGTYSLTGAAAKTFTFSNSLTLAGTDATTHTFPATSSSVARIDAAQTFTGIQTFSTVISGLVQTNTTGTSANFAAFGAGGNGLGGATTSAFHKVTANNIQYRVAMRGSTSTVATNNTDVYAVVVGDNSFTEAVGGTALSVGGLAVVTQTFTNGVGATTDFNNVWVGNAPTGAVNNYGLNTGLVHEREGHEYAYIAKTANYTATLSDHIINCTANTFQVTLPTAVGCAGRVYIITNPGGGTITIGTTSSQTFTNVTATPTTLTLLTLGASVQVASDGANWLKLN